MVKFLPALVLVLAVFCGCDRGPVEVRKTRVCMGTLVEITAIGNDKGLLDDAVEDAFSELKRLERLMSEYHENGDVSRINASAGSEPVEVDPEVLSVISSANKTAERTGGAFDITVAGLFDLWSFNPEKPRVPSDEQIQARLGLVSWKDVIIDKEGQRVGLAKKGMKIGLGGIAKGYAVDRAAMTLKKKGVTMAIVNAGGDVRCLGAKNGGPWKVGIQDPRDRQRIMAWIPITDRAVATSGDYEKFIVKDGKRYCHIIDPRTGKPADKCRSVTIVASAAWAADALATAVFVLGPEPGMALIEDSRGIEAVIIDSRGNILESSGIKGKVHYQSE